MKELVRNSLFRVVFPNEVEILPDGRIRTHVKKVDNIMFAELHHLKDTIGASMSIKKLTETRTRITLVLDKYKTPDKRWEELRNSGLDTKLEKWD